MKTKEEILAHYMPIILDKNFSRKEKEDFIYKAMDAYASQFMNFQNCVNCNGTGVMGNAQCGSCNGYGKVILLPTITTTGT